MEPLPVPVSEVERALRALGGEATVGDLVAVTAAGRADVGRALERLMVEGRAHVRVAASGEVVYHVGRRAPRVEAPAPSGRLGRRRWRLWARGSRGGRAAFDRKTAQLIRAREGVLSIAELVEHTGLRVAQAEREMARLAERFGGVPRSSLDGHVVWAFPELMTSAHGRFPEREPRPAWVRARPPVFRGDWLLRFFGPGRKDTIRRQLLGLVVQTALGGKGVVSLGRAVEYLERRAGRPVPRHLVEAALRQLAVDFDAPITTLDGDLFFGFRGLKRQFLASEVVRREMRLARTASGEVVFDSADPPARATERDLEAFDRELRKTMTTPG